MTAAFLDGAADHRSEPSAYRRSVVLRLTLIALLFAAALGAALPQTRRPPGRSRAARDGAGPED